MIGFNQAGLQMGFFSKLFGGGRATEAAQHEPDRVWLSRDACNRAIVRDMKAAEQAGVRVLVVAHFAETLEWLMRTPDTAVGDGSAAVLTSDLFRKGSLAPTDFQLVLVAERHPLRGEDDRIVQWAQTASGSVGGMTAPKVAFYLGLDDALLGVFAGQRTRDLLAMMGMNESEAINHPMLDRSLQNAQDNVAERSAGRNPSAKSAADWLAQIGMSAVQQ